MCVAVQSPSKLDVIQVAYPIRSWPLAGPEIPFPLAPTEVEHGTGAGYH